MPKGLASVAPTSSHKARRGLSREDSACFFGPPPLIAGEDPAQYEAIRAQISAAVQPLDFLEEIWVNGIVNLPWETLRLRRLRANLLKAAAPEGVHRILTPLSEGKLAETSRNNGQRARSTPLLSRGFSMG